MAKGDKGLSVKKSENVSEWYSEVIQKAELADLRYNVKGFLVHRPWAVLSMEKMYALFERTLQQKGHEPYWFPTVIPQSNLVKESDHLKGFTPEVFWVTEGGGKKLEEPLALRPTSETAFYQMFALWIRSYKDLPFKTYQRAQVFRHETKATRPFLRGREFYWIETHCVFKSEDDAMKQVHDDMDTTENVLHKKFGIPFLFFERPAWDKFAGAHRTFAADALNPDGKFVQQPSTHLIAQQFLKAFDVKFKDSDGKDKTPWSTCYGPAIWRMFGSVILVHGDDKGLRFPWEIAPKHVAFVPISLKKSLVDKAHQLAKKIEDIADTTVDERDVFMGEKFNYWELKGIPIRVDIGEKELENKKISVFRRDTGKKELIAEKDFVKYVEQVKKECTLNLLKEADHVFDGRIKNAKNISEVKKLVESGHVARCNFCSVTLDGADCGEKISSETGAQVRGTLLEKETPTGNCVVCGEKANAVVYIGKSY